MSARTSLATKFYIKAKVEKVIFDLHALKMTFGNHILFFFSLLGAFNGVVFGLYFLFFSARKNLSSQLLGALLLVASIRIGKSVAYFFDHALSRVYLQIGLTACAFIGPFLYLYVQSELKQVKSMPKTWLMQLGIWSLLVVGIGLFYSYEQYPKLWGEAFIPLIYLQWGIYVALSLSALFPVIKKLFAQAVAKPYEKLTLTICIAVFVLWFTYIWSYFNLTKGSYINGAIVFSIILYGIWFVLMYRRKTDDLTSLSNSKPNGRKYDIGEADRIVARLKKAMEERVLFKNPDLKIHELAKEINVTSHQLSSILNTHLEKNFTLFVNEYRIKEACKLLEESSHFAIEGIGDEVGFNAKSTFFAVFKKIMGMTPSAYQQTISIRQVQNDLS